MSLSKQIKQFVFDNILAADDKSVVLTGNECVTIHALAGLTEDEFSKLEKKFTFSDNVLYNHLFRHCNTYKNAHLIGWMCKHMLIGVPEIVNLCGDNTEGMLAALKNIPLDNFVNLHRRFAKTKLYQDNRRAVHNIYELRITQIRQNAAVTKSISQAISCCTNEQCLSMLCKTQMFDIDQILPGLHDLYSDVIAAAIIAHPTFDIFRHHELCYLAIKHSNVQTALNIIRKIETETDNIKSSMTTSMVNCVEFCNDSIVLQEIVNQGYGDPYEAITIACSYDEVMEHDLCILVQHPRFKRHEDLKLFTHAVRHDMKKLMRALL